MKYDWFELLNYKGFLSSGRISLQRGFNVIVGPNNAGKSALLEGISLSFENLPFKGMAGIDRASRESKPNAVDSEAIFSTTLSRSEMASLLSIDGLQVSIPTPKQGSPEFIKAGFNQPGPHTSLRFFKNLLNNPSLTFEVTKNARSQKYTPARFPTFGLYPPQIMGGGDLQSANVLFKYDGKLKDWIIGRTYNGAPEEELGVMVGSQLGQSTFSFRAEKITLSESRTGTSMMLARDATNLPEVILNMYLRKNYQFQRYLKAVKHVLPQIIDFGSSPIDSADTTKLFLWIEHPSTEDPRFQITLNNCGTGVGHVLALLYIAFNFEKTPRVIIVDEPTSFLHPGAIRSLFDILKEFDHQYVIATHSPIVLGSLRPEYLIEVQQDQSESHAEMVEFSDRSRVRTSLKGLGTSIADVLGLENALWVEGLTEEKCFTLIIRKLCNFRDSRYGIMSVNHTSDFDKKSAHQVYELYRKISNLTHMLPVNVIFIFDREDRTPSDLDRATRISDGRVRFLPRMMFENYLLSARAISAILNKHLTELHLAPDNVQGFIDSEAEKFIKKHEADEPDAREHWETRINAGKLMTDLFSSLTANCLEYRKTLHAPEIIEWLIEHEPAQLGELAGFLSVCLGTMGIEKVNE